MAMLKPRDLSTQWQKGLQQVENETHSNRLSDVERKALVVVPLKALGEVEAETYDRGEDQSIRRYGA